MLTALVSRSPQCGVRLECVTLEARDEVPATWFARYAFGIVRRGVLVRERFDPDQGRTAVDAAGRGAYVPLGLTRGGTGYAASRVLMCVYPSASLDGLTVQDGLGDLMKLAGETLERVERIAEARGRATAADRVAALHNTLEGCFGAHAFEDLLQRDLAALLGIRTETVCRVLRKRVRAEEPSDEGA